MQNRSGLSFVEFVGCLIALGGGVALGSVYLGLDLKQMAYEVVQNSGIVDPAEIGLENDPEMAVGGEAIDNRLDEELAESDETSLETNPSVETPEQQDVSDSQDGTAAVLDDSSMTEEERQAATVAYWESFVKTNRSEIRNRRPGLSDDNWQLLDYLTHRQKGHQEVLESIEDLDRRGVDARLLAHVDEVLQWHQAGNDLFTNAINLLTNGPRSRLSGPFAQSWQSAATQHKMEERLVRNKDKVILGYLNHTYDALAPFQGVYGH